jgi:primosomal protein N' (replication factor Y)
MLLMVPEIALTPSVAAVFRGTFGERVAIQHSALSMVSVTISGTASARRRDVVVVRLCGVCPACPPRLIVVDEEHDTSY